MVLRLNDSAVRLARTGNLPGETLLSPARLEPYTPTIATTLARKIERWESFSARNASQNEAKLTYIH
jgi:hypothetical protein